MIDPYRLRPLEDMVVVRMLREDNVRPSGIIIPENVMAQGCQAQVVAVSAVNEDLVPYANVIVNPDLDHERTYNWDFDGDEYWVIPMDLIECVVIHDDPLPDGLVSIK